MLCLKLVLDPVNRDITIKEEVAAKLVVSRAEVFERVMVRAKRHLLSQRTHNMQLLV